MGSSAAFGEKTAKPSQSTARNAAAAASFLPRGAPRKRCTAAKAGIAAKMTSGYFTAPAAPAANTAKATCMPRRFSAERPEAVSSTTDIRRNSDIASPVP